jgi:hypothetical protein
VNRLSSIRTARFLLLILLAAGSRAAAGAPPKVDVANDGVTCSTAYGTIRFSPPLVLGGNAASTTITVTGTVDGCVVSGPETADIAGPSKFVAKLTAATNDCAAVGPLLPVTGNLVVKWKASPSTPLLQASSTVAVTTLEVTSFHPALADAAFGAAALADFALGVGGVTGAFTGGDAGAASIIRLVTAQDRPTFVSRCNGAGVKSLAAGIGRLSLN